MRTRHMMAAGLLLALAITGCTNAFSGTTPSPSPSPSVAAPAPPPTDLPPLPTPTPTPPPVPEEFLKELEASPTMAGPGQQNLICQGRMATGTHIIQKWVPAGGWGWTNYRVAASSWAGDMCNNSDISVSIGLDEGVVARRGGYIQYGVWVLYVNMGTNKPGNWIWVPLKHSWPTLQFGRPISMTTQTQVGWVGISSVVWIKQDGSNWVPMTPRTWTLCSLRFSSSSNPGRCQAW